MLRKKGYVCEGLSSNPVISNGSGFELGFSRFMDVPILPDIRGEVAELMKDVPHNMSFSPFTAARYLLSRGKIAALARDYRNYRAIQRKISSSGYPAEKGGRRLMSVLNSSSYDTPLFMFLNFMEMHDPYIQGETTPSLPNSNHLQLNDLFGLEYIRADMMAAISSSYYSQSAVIDRLFGELLDYLRSTGIYDSSMVILTSDHGQALHENGFYGHGIFLHDELVRVPLIIKPPRGMKVWGRPGRLQSIVSLFDLISEASEGELNLDILTSDTAFAESFGMQHMLSDLSPEALSSIVQARRIIDQPRKAVYSGDYKLTAGGVSGEIEEFLYRGKRADWRDHRDAAGELVGELDIFKGNEDFNLPQV